MPRRSNDRASARRDRDLRGTELRATRDPRQSGGHQESRPGGGGRSEAVQFRALLPLRFFLGATFLYAGVDKLLDPAFLRAAGPGSIGAQLSGFVRFSPLAPLIEIFAQPMPLVVGTLIAVAEIAIGLGALTGLLYRASAAGGAALSLLFWLTASWATKPYYYGPDLPYALGWLTIALAGHGSLLVLDGRLAAWAAPRLAHARYGWPAPAGEIESWTTDPVRRGFLQLAVLGAGALVVAGSTGILGRTRSVPNELAQGVDLGPVPGGGDATAAPTGTGTPEATAAAAGTTAVPEATTPGNSPTPTPVQPGGPLVTTLDKLQPRHALGFQDPSTGDPAILVRLADGSVVAFDAVCTHQGCTVEYDRPSGFIFCPCHGAVFDPLDGARPIQGPTDIPLARLPINVDPTTGRITLVG